MTLNVDRRRSMRGFILANPRFIRDHFDSSVLSVGSGGTLMSEPIGFYNSVHHVGHNYV